MVGADKVKKIGVVYKVVFGVVTLIATPSLLEKIWPKNQPPVARIVATKQKGMVPLEVTFDGAKSSDPEGGSLKYYWLINTEPVSEKISYHHTFAQPGEYSVVLKVEDDGGLHYQDSVFVEVLSAADTNSISSMPPQAVPPTDAAKLQEKPPAPLIAPPSVSQSVIQHSVDPAAMTAAHNQLRIKAGVPDLKWSDTLAMDAQTWADHLKETNNCAPLNSNKGFSENIYRLGARVWSDGRRESSKIKPHEVVQRWEKGNTSYSNIADIVVTEVGCAMSFCEDKSQVWICYYSLPGNEASN